MARDLHFILAASVVGSCLALPAIAQQDQPEAAGQAAVSASELHFDEVDTDLNGAISREELRAALSGAEDPDEVFIEVDADQNGQISAEEWVSWRETRTATAAGRRPEIELGLTDDSIEGRYITNAGIIGLDQADLALGLFVTDDRDLVGQAQLMTSGLLEKLTPRFLSLSLGVKHHLALLADPDDEVVDFAPGAEARVSLPFDTPMAVVGSIFYAPDILTFGDADRAVDLAARFEVQFLERTTGFAGYRLLHFDREDDGDDSIVNSFQVGLRFAF